jgi:uncharacterized membrane protein
MDLPLFILTAVVLLFFDGIYLSLTKNYFTNQIIQVQRFTIQPNYMSAALCYLFLTFALYYFILLENRPLIDAAVLGLVIYGVYETTNMAILKKWKWQTVAIDTAWGSALFTLTTYYTRMLQRWIM